MVWHDLDVNFECTRIALYARRLIRAYRATLHADAASVCGVLEIPQSFRVTAS